MKRRTVLTAAGTTLVPLSGCTGSGAENETASPRADGGELVEGAHRPSSTEAPVQTLPAGDDTLRITDDDLYVDGTTAGVRGRVRNTAAHDVGSVTIYADFFDEDGDRLGRVHESLHDLPSGEAKRFDVTYEGEAEAERVADYELVTFGAVA